MKIRALSALTASITTMSVAMSWFNQTCSADILDQMFPGVPRQRFQRPNTQVPHATTLEDLLPRVDYPVKYMQAVPLHDLPIPGLDKNSLDTLGFNYFVAVDNAPYTDMSSLYRSNRLRGKSNFVTVDSILHPYLAFTNRVLANVIEHHIVSELSTLLKSMLVASLNDYQATQDKGIRQDIEYNIAYIGVALRLLDPKCMLPNKGNSVQLATDELKLISEGSVAISNIFQYEEDYSNYKPQGWYNSSPVLQNFYRAREWVSHMGYPLTETPAGNGAPINNFRRSILLYHSLEKATINDVPAWVTWKKICQVWKILGCFEGYPGNKVLLPDQYSAVLKELSPDLKVTLNGLTEPIYRAKLILVIKRQISSGLQATSITEMQSRESSKESVATFALFPPAGDPELPWMKAIAHSYIDQDQATEVVPIALSCLHARGAGQANNIMLSRLGRLNPGMMLFLPALDRIIKSSGTSRPWPILDTYSKFPAEGAQSALRTDAWMSRRVESAFAAWVDNHLAIARPVADTQRATNAAAAGNATTATASTKENPQIPSRKTAVGPRIFNSYTEEAMALTRSNMRTQVYFHYLEPSPESFQAICDDAQSLSRQLTQLGYLTQADSGRFLEFSMLCRRLTRIAICELKDRVLPVGDLKLLGNIDKTMESVDEPLGGIFYISGKEMSDGSTTGVNLALGHPAQLYVILQLGSKVWLGRGALYSYFEIGGGPISALHWARKLDYSLLRVPFWADKFDAIVQANETDTTKPGGAKLDAKPGAAQPNNTGRTPSGEPKMYSD
jgi:hypothetical protein